MRFCFTAIWGSSWLRAPKISIFLSNELVQVCFFFLQRNEVLHNLWDFVGVEISDNLKVKYQVSIADVVGHLGTGVPIFAMTSKRPGVWHVPYGRRQPYHSPNPVRRFISQVYLIELNIRFQTNEVQSISSFGYR